MVRLSCVVALALAVGCASSGSDESTPAGSGNGGGAGPGAGGGGMGGGGDGLPLGSPCTTADECASGLCEEVFLNLPDKVCVGRCGSQEDCPDLFCEAITPGSSDGYCIPRSPAHCVACEESSDCGYLSEICLIAPGDDALACHVDCALAGAAACPDDYTCESVEIGNQTRELCLPESGRCIDALGGFCNHVTMPLPCTRASADGTCVGARQCDAASERYGLCDAEVPACKASCDDVDPMGCVLNACPDAASTADNCGMCGTVCPGLGSPNANVTCVNAESCAFSCQGESYDVDGNVATGCEASDGQTGNHTVATSAGVGSFPCTDGSSNPNISGTLHSDTRVHENPVVGGFDTATGSAPDWYNLYADGGFCENEVVLSLDASGSGDLACYQDFLVNTDVGTYTCTSNANGDCSINEDGTGLYSDDSTIYIQVSRTCAAGAGNVSYTVTGHL